MAVIRLKKPVADASPVDRAEAFFAWLADTFVFAAGPKRGQPLILEPFQQDYVRLVLERDGPDPAHRMAIFSTPRKNGKTLVLATLLLGFMLPDSPVSIPGCRAGITAPTGRHAMFIFQAALELLDAAGRKGEAKVIQHPSPGYFTTKGGARCDIYSGSKTSGHGASLNVALVDEAGLLKRNSVLIDNFTDALAIENGILLVTGTLGESREYAELIDNPPRARLSCSTGCNAAMILPARKSGGAAIPASGRSSPNASWLTNSARQRRRAPYATSRLGT